MGILSQDKSSKKRKRSKSSDGLDQQTINSKKSKDEIVSQVEIEAKSPEQKPAKKRKKDKLNASVNEDSHTKEDTTEKQPTEKKSKKRKRTDEEQENDLSSSHEKPKKEKKKKSTASSEKADENVSNNDSEPKKEKKKKKQKSSSSFGVVDSKLLKESGGEVKKDVAEQSRINRAVDYLHLWKKDRKSWKFNKNFQSLLIKAVYNSVIIPDDDFDTLLLYFEGCKGHAREILKKDAMAFIKEDEDDLDDQVDPDKEKRARQIIQILG